MYWKVTGSKWSVPIEKAQANITLDFNNNATTPQVACYTDCDTKVISNSKILVNTTSPLVASEGLTFVVGFPKNLVVVVEPKDSHGKTLLPAEVGTLVDEHADNKDIAATIVDLAVRGFLKIKEVKKGKDYQFTRAQGLKNFLSSQERQLEFQAEKWFLFEKLLPFAIVFGVEHLSLKPPSWYEGSYGPSFNSTVFTHNLTSATSNFANISSPASSTRSSSGFSSGFSGGGGGGFGGGGGSSW